MIRRATLLGISTAYAIVGMTVIALAQTAVPSSNDDDDDDDVPGDPDTGETFTQERKLGILPNPLKDKGIKFAVTYIGETLGNPTGGLKQGAVYDGRLNLAADINFEKLAGWRGLFFYTNVFQIHGDGLARSNLNNLLGVSGVEALPATRLYEMWFEQKSANGNTSIRLGQFAADTEFLNSKYTGAFTNGTLGWPAITAINLPSGGPAPPLAAVGARFRTKLSDNVTVLGAIFNGNSAGPGPDDPQQRNRYGLNFRVNDPPLVMGEIQYAWNHQPKSPSLPGTLKFGGWRHFGSFDDVRWTAEGLSRADPAGSGMAAQLRGDFGVYSVIEQCLYRVPGSTDRGVGVFGRVSASPSDRNLIDFYADGGVEFNGLSDAREHDKLGIAFAYAHLSGKARALDQDFARTVRADWPLRSYEGLITAVYQYEIQSGWTLQPNVQYVIHPGAGATDPTGSNPGVKLKNAAVMGLRTVVKF